VLETGLLLTIIYEYFVVDSCLRKVFVRKIGQVDEYQKYDGFFKAVIMKAELLHLCTRCIEPDKLLYMGSGYDTTRCACNRVRKQQGAATTGRGYNRVWASTGCGCNRVRASTGCG
jgi:hypothetical protein